MNATTHYRHNSFLPFLLLILLAFAVLAIVAADQVKITSNHAVLAHGNEAIQIRNCLNNSGPEQTWKSFKEDDVFYHLCQLENGKWGIRAMIYRAGEWIERTAFVPKDGSWMRVTNYLSKFATRYKGGMP